jgi:hypothetical protein
VLKWENAGDNVPRIKWSIERDIRLFILGNVQNSEVPRGSKTSILKQGETNDFEVQM